MIRSACSNLIHNAVHHTPSGTHLHIGWEQDADGPRFSVADDGEGIPLVHLPRLTERFYRVDQGRSRATGGTGLGLAIVKHVLNRHGAQLLITSEVGTGARFTCQFPPSRWLPRPAVTNDHSDALHLAICRDTPQLTRAMARP